MKVHKIVPVPEVEPCITQVFPKDDGTWWRYCLTCDDGSNKYHRHFRGHKTEEDAQMSARDHAKAATANRQWKAWHKLWVAAMLATSTWEEYVAVYQERAQYWSGPQINWDNIPVEARERVMRQTKELEWK